MLFFFKIWDGHSIAWLQPTFQSHSRCQSDVHTFKKFGQTITTDVCIVLAIWTDAESTIKFSFTEPSGCFEIWSDTKVVCCFSHKCTVTRLQWSLEEASDEKTRLTKAQWWRHKLTKARWWRHRHVRLLDLHNVLLVEARDVKSVIQIWSDWP